MYIHWVCAQALFASVQLDWVTTTGRLLGPTTCLPHESGGNPLSNLPKQACRLVLHTVPILPSAKQGSCEYHFLKSFGMTRLGK